MADPAAPESGEVATVGTFTVAGGKSGGGIGAVVGAVIGIGFVIGARFLKKDPYEDYVAPEPEQIGRASCRERV